MVRFAFVVVVLVIFTCQNTCEGRSLRKRQSAGPRNENVQDLLLTYQMESVGSGATNMRLVGADGNDMDGIEGLDELTVGGEGGPNLSDEQIDQGTKSLEPFKLDPDNTEVDTGVQFAFPVLSPYPLTEDQKRNIYRKTIELCRMIRKKLARTMNVQVECSFPGR